MSAEQALVSILQSRQPTSFVLRGPWGRGKTHLWKHLVTQTRPVHWDSYSYVSLFGLNSIEELKTAIFESGCAPAKAHADPVALSLDSSVGEAHQELKRNWRSMLKTALKLDIPSVGNVSPVFQSLLFYGVRKRLICLDDIERRGDGLALKDVLGFVSLLCEERHCAVVVITNDKALDEKDAKVWNRYQEKVFRGEVFFDPEPSQCVDLVLSEEWQDEAWSYGLGKALNEIGVSNVRLIMRARQTVEALRAQLPDVSFEAAITIARSVGRIVYFHCGRGEGAPPLEWAMRRNNADIVAGTNEDNRTDEQKEWDKVLADLSFAPAGIDLAVGKFVRDGFVDPAFLRSQVDLFEENLKFKEQGGRWESAWSAYRSSFRCQQPELTDLFRKALPYASKHVSAMDVDLAVVLLRGIGSGQLADEFASAWVAEQLEKGSDISLAEIETFGPVRDPVFRTAIERAQQATATTLSLAQMFVDLSKGNNSEQALARLATASVAEVEIYITENSGHYVRRAIRNVLESRIERANLTAARAVLNQAAANLAAVSALNEHRVRQMGFTLPPP